MEQVTIDSIIAYLGEKIEKHEPLPPSIFLDAAIKMNVLLGNEHEKEADLYQKVAAYKVVLIQEGATVAKANVLSQASEEFKEHRKQLMKMSRVEEFIRLSKIQARLRDSEMRLA